MRDAENVVRARARDVKLKLCPAGGEFSYIRESPVRKSEEKKEPFPGFAVALWPRLSARFN